MLFHFIYIYNFKYCLPICFSYRLIITPPPLSLLLPTVVSLILAITGKSLIFLLNSIRCLKKFSA